MGTNGTRRDHRLAFVVSRGHPELLAELRAAFRDWAGIDVIEDRRQDGQLLPRRDACGLIALDDLACAG